MKQPKSIADVFQHKKENILSLYFTAGYPFIDSTPNILNALNQGDVDLVEIGIPFSDPIADGETIQASNQEALNNGMNLPLLFQQLEEMPTKLSFPILLMGYINPIFQFGIENFCKKCQELGISGVIIPDLPLFEYKTHYQHIFQKYNVHFIFLITPQTSTERIQEIDNLTESFIYLVASFGVTGAKSDIYTAQKTYFQRIKDMRLKNPLLVGFGISNHTTFSTVCKYFSGAIIGSAFIDVLQKSNDLDLSIKNFVQKIRG